MPFFHLSPVDMTGIYFCPHKRSSSLTKFYIITFFQPLHVFLCSKTFLKKVLGRWDTFIWPDMQAQVIGSSVLDLQDKQWHIGVTYADLRRALNWGLKLWQYAWCHKCAWMAWITIFGIQSISEATACYAHLVCPPFHVSSICLFHAFSNQKQMKPGFV